MVVDHGLIVVWKVPEPGLNGLGTAFGVWGLGFEFQLPGA